MSGNIKPIVKDAQLYLQPSSAATDWTLKPYLSGDGLSPFDSECTVLCDGVLALG